MLRWALVFLIIALIAAGLGFTGVAGAAAGIAKILFWLFFGVLLLVLLTAWIGGRAARSRDVA